MKITEIRDGLAAMFYYQSPGYEKGSSFEALENEKTQPFLSLADAVIEGLDKMSLTIVPKSTKNQEQVEALLRDRIESEVKAFFDGIKIFKKGAIPQEELVARVWSVWKNL